MNTHKLALYAQLMRLDKPIGILLLLWPTMWALWIATEGNPNLWILFVFIMGVVLMRSAGCVINDYADRKIDPHVSRTKLRPLAAGLISSKEALILFALLCLVAFALVLTLNTLTIYLSFIGAFLAASYPFMKRYTHLPQAYLGAAFGWAVPMVFAATGEQIPFVAWLIFSATLLWAVAYDTMYAMVDRKDDLKIGVKSTAILFGQHDKLIIGLIQVALLAVFIWIGLILQLSTSYYIAIAASASLSVYQQVLIKERNEADCFQAFLNNHWLGLIMFTGLLLHYALN